MKIIGIRKDRCTGCKTCELSCAVERCSEAKTLLGAVQETPLPQSRVRVEGGGGDAFPLQCRHCLQAPCIDACLSGALRRDGESGLVLIKEDLCIGCWTCIAFCPFGAIYPSPERKIVLKCDRCLYMEKPVCVDVCPTGALEVVDLAEIEDLIAEKRRVTAQAAAAAPQEGLVLLDLER